MKRWLFGAAIGLLLSTVPTGLSAQDRPAPNLGGRLSRYREETDRQTSARSLIVSKAQFEARQRTLRLEAQYAAGISPNRPVMAVPPVFASTDYWSAYHPWVVSYYQGW